MKVWQGIVLWVLLSIPASASCYKNFESKPRMYTNAEWRTLIRSNLKSMYGESALPKRRRLSEPALNQKLLSIREAGRKQIETMFGKQPTPPKLPLPLDKLRSLSPRELELVYNESIPYLQELGRRQIETMYGVYGLKNRTLSREAAEQLVRDGLARMFKTGEPAQRKTKPYTQAQWKYLIDRAARIMSAKNHATKVQTKRVTINGTEIALKNNTVTVNTRQGEWTLKVAADVTYLDLGTSPNTIITGRLDGSIEIYNYKSSAIVEKIPSASNTPITNLKTSKNGDFRIIRYANTKVSLWNKAAARFTNGNIKNSDYGTFSPDGTKAAFVNRLNENGTGTVTIVDLATSRSVTTKRIGVSMYISPVSDVLWSKDGAYLAISYRYGTVRLYNAATGTVVKEMRTPGNTKPFTIDLSWTSEGSLRATYPGKGMKPINTIWQTP